MDPGRRMHLEPRDLGTHLCLPAAHVQLLRMKQADRISSTLTPEESLPLCVATPPGQG